MHVYLPGLLTKTGCDTRSFLCRERYIHAYAYGPRTKNILSSLRDHCHHSFIFIHAGIFKIVKLKIYTFVTLSLCKLTILRSAVFDLHQVVSVFGFFFFFVCVSRAKKINLLYYFVSKCK